MRQAADTSAFGRDRRAWRACEGKARMPSEHDARTVGRARLAKEKRAGRAYQDRFWPYACTFCRGWHLSSTATGGGSVLAVTASELREGLA